MESFTKLHARDNNDKASSLKRPQVRHKVAGLWERLRHWVDGDNDPAEKIQEHVRGLRPSEKFLKAVAQELETSLMDEAFAPQGLPLCVPQEFNIFLDPETDKEWVGNKRHTLEQALNLALIDKVRDLAGDGEIESPAPVVVLRVDGTLKKDQIRIKASWDQARPGNTLVTPSHSANHYDPDATHVYMPGENPDGDVTQVIIAGVPLYHLEIWRSNARETVIPVTRDVITLGRGAKTVPVDVRLQDPNVSRQHATVEREPDGTIWVTHRGQNPTAVGGHNIGRGERVKVEPGESIDICAFSLHIVEG